MTLKKLAEELNLSVATVSQALKDEPGVRLSQETRDRVRAEAQRRGYRPNLQARHLVKQRAEGVVPIFCAELPVASAHVEKLRALQEHLIDYGYQAAMTLGKGSEGPRTSGLLKSLCQQRPQGLIWLYTLWRTQEPDLADILEGYVAEGGILVTLDNAVVAPGDQVIFDREHNTYLATKHLLDLGHRDLGLHLGPFGESFHSPRLPGAQRAMREQGLDAERLCRFDSHSLSQYEAGLELAQGYLARSDRPTGMVILNDQTALAFMTAVLAAGVRIPQDVSVVGHDNEPWGAYLPTPLTTVTHPFREVAAAAAALLHDRLRGSQTGPPQRVRVQSDLIIRASTGPPP